MILSDIKPGLESTGRRHSGQEGEKAKKTYWEARMAIFLIYLSSTFPTGDIPLDRNSPKEHSLYYKT